jgi:hypothetical protein
MQHLSLFETGPAFRYAPRRMTLKRGSAARRMTVKRKVALQHVMLRLKDEGSSILSCP